MEEPECCKCDQSRAPVRTPDLSKPNSSVWSLFLSIMMTAIVFGLMLELVS